MVELVPAVCPKCGANLQLPENLERAHCMYCGTEIIIEIKKPDIHYHGVGSLDNYLKLGERKLSTAIQMEKAGIEKQARTDEKLKNIGLIMVGLLFFIILIFSAYSIVFIGFLPLLFFILFIVYFLLTKGTSKWITATPLFLEHIEEAVKYYSKAMEIDPENEEANRGYNESSQLRKKYYG